MSIYSDTRYSPTSKCLQQQRIFCFHCFWKYTIKNACWLHKNPSGINGHEELYLTVYFLAFKKQKTI